LVELLSRDLERQSASATGFVIAGVLAVAAVALVITLGPRGGDDRDRQRARVADERARQGDYEAASAEWLRLWPAHRSPGLAARLAWAELRGGRVGAAAGWILRGAEGEPRDPALGFVAARVREAGGLAGEWHGRLPIRSLEWGVLAGLLSALALAWWPNRRLAAIGLGLALLVVAVPAAERLLRERAHLAVVLRATPLAGADVDLEAGQVVRVVERAGPEAVVRIGTIEGRLPADALAADPRP
jgi:hypothetical protein